MGRLNRIEKVEKIKELSKQDVTIAQMALTLDCSQSFIHKIIKEFGIERKKQKPGFQARKPKTKHNACGQIKLGKDIFRKMMLRDQKLERAERELYEEFYEEIY